MMNHRNVLVVLVVLGLATAASALEPREPLAVAAEPAAGDGLSIPPASGSPAALAEPRLPAPDDLAKAAEPAGQAAPQLASGLGQNWACEEPTGFDTKVRCAPACGLGGETCTKACSDHLCGREGCLYAEGKAYPTCHCLVPF